MSSPYHSIQVDTISKLLSWNCGGAAAVIGAARSIASLEPDGVEIHFIVPACENMINEKAYVPSDVLTAMNGKTIEVMNTDAEGRLTLADALCYADKVVGVDKLVEISTLTGTAIAFLGQKISGFWTDDDGLANLLGDASKISSDKAWRMPLEKEYADQLDSLIADMKNLGSRWGGPITAALFLLNFVDPKKPFAHIDMAGPVWDEKSGATGYGAKLLTSLILLESKKVEASA
jgi:leucyl aminopeptidase